MRNSEAGLCARVVGVSAGRTKGQPNVPQPSIVLDRNGVRGDRHAGPGPRQVTLFDSQRLRALAPPGTADDALPGTQNDNLAVEGLASLSVRLLDEFDVADARLEVTVLGEALHAHGPDPCAEHGQGEHCAMGLEGIFARVLRGGLVQAGDRLTHRPRALRAEVITMSDRVSRGKSEDRSGPIAVRRLRAWCGANGWGDAIAHRALPDERAPLAAALHRARADRAHLVFITGGTGLAPRDITPEVVASFADRGIPGVVEHTRVRGGDTKPLALLSRSAAVQIGETLVIAAPGSPGGVEDYLATLELLLGHLLLVVRGIDPH